jgi:hypothetical protein
MTAMLASKTYTLDRPAKLISATPAPAHAKYAPKDGGDVRIQHANDPQ